MDKKIGYINLYEKYGKITRTTSKNDTNYFEVGGVYEKPIECLKPWGDDTYIYENRMIDVFKFNNRRPFRRYGDYTERLFEFEILGDTVFSKQDFFHKLEKPHCFTNKVKIIREISEREYINYVKENLDSLVIDEYSPIREEIARCGLAHDILINDPEEDVRVDVATYCNSNLLEKLLYDKSDRVRYCLAARGYRLDILKNDEDSRVTLEVENQLRNRNLFSW